MEQWARIDPQILETKDDGWYLPLCDERTVGHPGRRRWSRVLGVFQEGNNLSATITIRDVGGVNNTTNNLSSSRYI
jgi:hypothetical protein